MTLENMSDKNYWYGTYEGYEARCQRRLQHDLGVDQAAAETILHLRRQVVELQSRVRQLEAELTVRAALQELRLAHYREVYFEADWIEVEFQE